jgi:hypothetical protein
LFTASFSVGCAESFAYRVTAVPGGSYGKGYFIVTPPESRQSRDCSLEAAVGDVRKQVTCESHYVMSCDAARPGEMCRLISDTAGPIEVAR